MSSFKKADGIIDSIQKQATGLRTLDGSAIEDFLSIAGYEKSAGGGEGGGLYHVICTKENSIFSLDKSFNELSAAVDSGLLPYISMDVSLWGGPLVIGTMSALHDDGEGAYIAEFNMGDQTKYNFSANDPDENFTYTES